MDSLPCSFGLIKVPIVIQCLSITAIHERSLQLALLAFRQDNGIFSEFLAATLVLQGVHRNVHSFF